MADRPIIFSGPMVRALLAGRKTQTRRLINPQPPEDVTSAGVMSNSIDGQLDQWTWVGGDPRDVDTWTYEGDFKVRYRPGDRLYVREAISVRDVYTDVVEVGYQASERESHSEFVEQIPLGLTSDAKVSWPKYKPSIHMPRWASRITLFVEEVRVERLQSISEYDAIAEGVERGTHPISGEESGWKDYSIIHSGPHKAKRHPHAIAPWKSAQLGFRSLWETLHGENSWVANPWVVAVTFRAVPGNIDQVPHG